MESDVGKKKGDLSMKTDEWNEDEWDVQKNYLKIDVKES